MTFIRAYIFLIVILTLFISIVDCCAQKPLPPTINWVSLKNGSDTGQINWTLSPSLNVANYIVRRSYPKTLGGWASGWITIDTSFSSSMDTFTFVYLPVLNDSVSFRMWAVNDSGSTSALSFPPHTLNYLTVIPDSCNYSIHLNWTGYVGWGDSLDTYQVWVNHGNRPDSLFKIIPAGEDSINFLKPMSDTMYSFIIKAINRNGMVSFSNRKETFVHIPKSPNYIKADYASVNASNNIELSFSIDPASDLHTYALWRAESATGIFYLVKTFTSVNAGNLYYVDLPADPLIRHYYNLTAWNNCNQPREVSNLAGNIVLHDTTENSRVLLNWNKYTSWAGVVGIDTLMRSTPEGGWEFVASIGPSDNTYTDDLDLLGYRNYKYTICYYIKATQDSLNPDGIMGVSLSNVACVPAPVDVRIPNAFTPNDDGKNDIFMPLFKFTPEVYLLKIFDRNGNILFLTTNESEGWNGTDMKGRKVPQGTYVYYLRYSFQGQSARELRGMISVIYP